MFSSLLLSLTCALSSPIILSHNTSPSIDSMMRAKGMVTINSLSPQIAVDLRYATTNNFMHTLLYEELDSAYLEKGFAKRIAKAQQLLEEEKPGYRLVIFDAARPISVQRKMYARVEGTPLKVYVANGKKGGRHNYGVAVDLSIMDNKGKLLDMGTPFDHFGKEAHTDKEEELVRQGLISPQARKNRVLLRTIMGKVGLRCYHREWWHFQEKIDMPEVRKRYKLLDF